MMLLFEAVERGKHKWVCRGGGEGKGEAFERGLVIDVKAAAEQV